MSSAKADVWQGTLALMILKTVEALGPLHGYGIARRIEQTSGESSRRQLRHHLPCAAETRAGRLPRGRVGNLGERRRARFYKPDACRTEATGARDAAVGRDDVHSRALPRRERAAVRAVLAFSVAADRSFRRRSRASATLDEELERAPAAAHRRQPPRRHDAGRGAGARAQAGRRRSDEGALSRSRMGCRSSTRSGKTSVRRFASHAAMSGFLLAMATLALGIGAVGAIFSVDQRRSPATAALSRRRRARADERQRVRGERPPRCGVVSHVRRLAAIKSRSFAAAAAFAHRDDRRRRGRTEVVAYQAGGPARSSPSSAWLPALGRSLQASDDAVPGAEDRGG